MSRHGRRRSVPLSYREQVQLVQEMAWPPWPDPQVPPVDAEAARRTLEAMGFVFPAPGEAFETMAGVEIPPAPTRHSSVWSAKEIIGDIENRPAFRPRPWRL